MALDLLPLTADDIVTVITTSNNLYISACVTNEIEKYCKWSRNLEVNTKVVLINHEFGYYSNDVGYYKSLGYVVIEDFAHSFYTAFSRDSSDNIGDYLIFSLSKYFSIQAGGILLCPKEYLPNLSKSDVSDYCEKVVSGYVNQIERIARERLKNYHYYELLFNTLGLKPYFKMNKHDCPGVFCFTVSGSVDLQEMKCHLNRQGIESSVLYGANAYLFLVIRYFQKRKSSTFLRQSSHI